MREHGRHHDRAHHAGYLPRYKFGSQAQKDAYLYACLECGTCLAVAAPGALTWHYPRGGFGVQFREG